MISLYVKKDKRKELIKMPLKVMNETSKGTLITLMKTNCVQMKEGFNKERLPEEKFKEGFLRVRSKMAWKPETGSIFYIRKL